MVILFLLAKVVLFSESHSFYRSSHRRCSVKEVLRNFAKNTGKYLCESLFFLNVAGLCNFIKKEALARVFFYEFCEIFKTTFFKEHLWQLLLFQKWFLSMKNIPFSASICFQWRPQLIFSLDTHFFFPGATPFQYYLFLLVKSITLQWKQLLLMKAISFSGMHSFYGR